MLTQKASIYKEIRDREIVQPTAQKKYVEFFENDDLKWKETGAPNENFRKNICLEDDLRSIIFGTFVVKFIAFLPLLGFSNI